MTELEQVKQEVYNQLFLNGYSHEVAKAHADAVIKVTGYYLGKPSRYLTNARDADGNPIQVEIYL